MIIKPTGKITAIDVGTITAAYGSVSSGAQKLRTKEIFRASCCLLYTSPSPRDGLLSRMPSSA